MAAMTAVFALDGRQLDIRRTTALWNKYETFSSFPKHSKCNINLKSFIVILIFLDGLPSLAATNKRKRAIRLGPTLF
jgi:hypothetical protein